MLEDDAWLPPAIDITRLAERMARAELTDELAQELRTRPVELLAIAFAAVTERGAKTEREQLALEMLGLEVSPGFAAYGQHACNVIEAAVRLNRGEPVRPLWWASVCLSIGELWNAAFTGPDGFQHYIASSVAGNEPSAKDFFSDLPRLSEQPSHADRSEHLVRMIDLLQVAIASNNLPDRRVGVALTPAAISNAVCQVGTINLGIETIPVIVHVHGEAIPGGRRITVALTQGRTGGALGSISAVVLRAVDGRYDEYPPLADRVSHNVSGIVADVFSPSASGFLPPQVRVLLDECGNVVPVLCVIEDMVVHKRFRQRDVGKRLIQQLIIEAGDIEVLLARTVPAKLPGDRALTRGTTAGYAVGAIKLAATFAGRLGGMHLARGVMGLSPRAIEPLRAAGLALRTAL